MVVDAPTDMPLDVFDDLLEYEHAGSTTSTRTVPTIPVPASIALPSLVARTHRPIACQDCDLNHV